MITRVANAPAPLTWIFTTSQEARKAILALEAAGVPSRSISVVTRVPRDAESIEHDTGASDDLEDAAYRGRLTEFVDWLGRLGGAAVPGFGSVLGTGNLWQDVARAGRGRGSITGALVGVGVAVDEAERLEKAVFKGATLVVVHGTFDPSRAKAAVAQRPS
jgi:hypothetical protein